MGYEAKYVAARESRGVTNALSALIAGCHAECTTMLRGKLLTTCTTFAYPVAELNGARLRAAPQTHTLDDAWTFCRLVKRRYSEFRVLRDRIRQVGALLSLSRLMWKWPCKESYENMRLCKKFPKRHLRVRRS